MSSHNTIAAISTAFGNAGIAIVRISGKESLSVLKKTASFIKKTKLISHKMYFGEIREKKQLIDQVLVVYFKAPRSFTGEDSVELHCHGGYITAQKILAKVVAKGASLAKPGEFTQRAFMNGKIDLAQAEAVADVIYAKSDKAQEIAQNQLKGGLSDSVKKILNSVLVVYSHLAVNLDYPEEDIPEISKKEIITKLKASQKKIKKLLESTKIATLYKEGAKVVIVGLPNAGKSSLLNALVRDARAIVTEIPGTTRDVLEDQIEISGILIRLFDTAGVCDTEDRIEKEGVARSIRAIEEADLVLLVLERYPDFNKFLSHLKPKAKEKLRGKKIIVARNKIDKRKRAKKPQTLSPNVISLCEISAKTNKGVDKVEKAIEKEIKKEDLDFSVLVTSMRQKKLLEKAQGYINEAISLAQKSKEEDKILIELDSARQALAEIIGEEITSAMLEKIFARFCVGK